MHMYFYDLIIRHQYDRIADGGKKFFEFMFFFLRHLMIQKNNKLCAVTKLNIRFRLGRYLRYRRYAACLLESRVIHFLAKEPVDSSPQYLYKSLPA